VKISNGSIKRCKLKFDSVGVGKQVNTALSLLEHDNVNAIIAEFIYDSDNDLLYNVLLFLIRENCKDEKILKELLKFEYKIG